MQELDTKMESIYEEVASPNPGGTRIRQAVREVMNSLKAILSKHPEIVEQRIIERICEPYRQLVFKSGKDG